jgi:hypothetical protein
MTNIWPLQKDCISFYGNPASPGWLHDNTTYVACPWTLYVGATPTSHILIHKKCADSLARVLNNVWDACGKDVSKIKEQHFDRYDGSYNFRPMRGAAAMSMHSFACAIDWDAAENAFHSQKHLFTDQSLLVVKFKEEGWIWGGDWSPGSQDAMHVQAARIHS